MTVASLRGVWLRSVLLGAALMLVAPVAQAFQLTVAPARALVEVEPGGTSTFPVMVTNEGDLALYVRGYAVDLAYVEGKGLLARPPGTTEHSAVNWIQVVPREMDLPAHESAQFQVTVSAPPEARDAAYATVFVHTQIANTASGSGSKMQGRIGVHAFVRVRGTGTEAVDVRSVDFVAPTETSPGTISLLLENTGSVYVQPEFKGMVRTTDGEVLGRIDARAYRPFLPGEPIPLEMHWSGFLEPGAYELVGTVLFGDQRALPLVHPFAVQDPEQPPAGRP